MECPKIEIHHQQIFGLDAQIDLLCILHAAQKKSGAYQRNQRQRLGIFIGHEKPAHWRAQSQNVKIIGAHQFALHLSGLRAAAPRQ